MAFTGDSSMGELEDDDAFSQQGPLRSRQRVRRGPTYDAPATIQEMPGARASSSPPLRLSREFVAKATKAELMAAFALRLNLPPSHPTETTPTLLLEPPPPPPLVPPPPPPLVPRPLEEVPAPRPLSGRKESGPQLNCSAASTAKPVATMVDSVSAFRDSEVVHAPSEGKNRAAFGQGKRLPARTQQLMAAVRPEDLQGLRNPLAVPKVALGALRGVGVASPALVPGPAWFALGIAIGVAATAATVLVVWFLSGGVRI